jgi:hypothetical protein
MTDIVERLREGKTDGTHLRWMVTNIHLEAAAEVERLRGENSYLSEEVISALKAEVERLATCLATSESLKAGYIGTVEKQKAEIERLRAALESCASWVERWAPHAGNCAGGDKCTCGRSAVLFEATAAPSNEQLTHKEDAQ